MGNTVTEHIPSRREAVKVTDGPFNDFQWSTVEEVLMKRKKKLKVYG